MPLFFGLVRRVLVQAQNKRLLKRMGDKYADIRLSGATQRASQCSSSNASPVASRTTTTPSQNSPPASHHHARQRASSNGNSSSSRASSRRGSQSRLSVSVVVPVHSAEALWIDKLRAQEESYRRSVSGVSVASNSGNRRRCESEDEAFELWDYVCPQFVRPKLANEWV